MRFITVLGVAVLTLIAGFVPAVLFFRTTRMTVVVGFGVSGIILSWVLLSVTPLPPVVIIGLNGLNVFPFWAGLMAFVAGAVAQAVVTFRQPEGLPAEEQGGATEDAEPTAPAPEEIESERPQ